MNKELLLEVRRKYYLLNLINRNHELLRYFILEEDNTFTPTSDENLEYEFINRFRGDTLSIEDYLKVKTEKPYEDYLQELYGSLFSNYKSVLEREINCIEARN